MNHNRQSSSIQGLGFFLIVVFMMIIASGEIDICVPSFPEISDQFGLSVFATELLLGVNLVAHCLGSVLAGNLGDHYGKRPIVYAGLGVFILGSLGCFLASSYPILIFFRFLQGLGVALPMVLGPLLVMDFYPPEKHEKMISMLNGVTTLALSAAPTLGSYTTLWWGWRFNFALLAFFGGIAVLLLSQVSSSRLSSSQPVSGGLSLKAYLPVLRSTVVMQAILSLCLLIGLYYTFVAMAPMIYVKAFGVPLKELGLYQGVLTLTFGVISIFNDRIVNFLGRSKMFRLSFGLIFLFMALCALLVIFQVRNPVLITAVMFLLSVGVVYPINSLYVFALRGISEAGGKISAVITVEKWILSILGFQLASWFYTQNFTSTGAVILGMGGLLFFFFFSYISGFLSFERRSVKISSEVTE